MRVALVILHAPRPTACSNGSKGCMAAKMSVSLLHFAALVGCQGGVLPKDANVLPRMTSKGRTKQQLHVCAGPSRANLMWEAAPADKRRRRVMSEAGPALRCTLQQSLHLPTIAQLVLEKATALLHGAYRRDCRDVPYIAQHLAARRTVTK